MSFFAISLHSVFPTHMWPLGWEPVFCIFTLFLHYFFHIQLSVPHWTLQCWNGFLLVNTYVRILSVNTVMFRFISVNTDMIGSLLTNAVTFVFLLVKRCYLLISFSEQYYVCLFFRRNQCYFGFPHKIELLHIMSIYTVLS